MTAGHVSSWAANCWLGTILVAGLVTAGSAAEPPRLPQVKPPVAQQRQPPLQAVAEPDIPVLDLDKDEKTPPMTKEEVKKKAEELRKKYPLVSLASRLAYEDRADAQSQAGPAPKLDEEATKHLEALEVAGQRHTYFGNGMRPRALAMVHSEQVERFITREGFGLSRMPQPTTRNLELVDTDAVSYPRYLLESTEADDVKYMTIGRGVSDAHPWNLPSRELLFGFHLAGQLDFASPASLGLVRDRDHVAGFKSHQFRSVPQLVSKWDRELKGPPVPPAPKPVEQWVVRKLELVSLLKHEKPAVYVSTHLPKMDELAEADTRELSKFEADSLQSLRSGESLVARAKTNHLEMVGALRAGKQCQQCHQVQRGELLGAFSYELHRSPELKAGKSAATSGGG